MRSASNDSLIRRYRVGCVVARKYWIFVILLLTLPSDLEGAFHSQTTAIRRQHDGGISSSYPMRQQSTTAGVPLASFPSGGSTTSSGTTRSSSTRLSSENNSGDGEQNVTDWLQTASRLRKEVREMETTIDRGEDAEQRRLTTSDPSGKSIQQSERNIVYTSLEDSSWTVSYRFASEPTRKDNSEEDDSTALRFYSGKISVKFRGDGYTDIVNDDELQNNSGVEIVKFWGWDAELSSEDNRKYLEFSADVLLPTSDSNYSARENVSRFYFNARVDEDSKTGEITFSDGTVTLKRDVEPPAGVWGMFNAGGILAQFKYCGEFLCKAKQS